MTELGSDWRVVDGVAAAWFDAPSLREGAALAARVVALSAEIPVDVRASGVRVRLGSDEHAPAVSAAARELGLTADPAALQHLSVGFDSPDPGAVMPFWQRALDYAPTRDGDLADPLHRDPELRFRLSDDPRPLRNRVHLDVVRPASAVERAAGLGEPFGAFGVCHADADGNEVDLVPGDALDEQGRTADWQAVFSAIACYRVTSPAQQAEVAAAAAALADGAGYPLLVDLRPGYVVLDTGKDRWDADAHGLDLDFTGLAQRLQTAARELGATADPAAPRFVQLYFDAADVAAVRAFWVAALGYVHDRRTKLTDIVDPRQLNPVLAFQEIDVADTERRQQRNRIQVELAVPADLAQARVAAAVAAGGRVLDESVGRRRVADPEGNELVVVSV
ncbi:VOC family protein [Cellulomonas sp.]|uniref:VOC family protein n=1 Tax=Cellulomonas sp. TaxID=40001 RepID=UPI001B0A6FC9|nr:VOC family protein [Cellulomonas sp.]MBO9553232.1 hypothetical protein [Cellulomonas sp.]